MNYSMEVATTKANAHFMKSMIAEVTRLRAQYREEEVQRKLVTVLHDSFQNSALKLATDLKRSGSTREQITTQVRNLSAATSASCRELAERVGLQIRNDFEFADLSTVDALLRQVGI